MSSVAKLALVTLLLVGGSARAHAAPDTNKLKKLVAQLAGGNAHAARRALFRLGPSALEPLRVEAVALGDAASRERALSVWRSLIHRHALAHLAKGPGGKKPKWKLAVQSDLFPYLRCYRAEGKYPQAVILDVERSEELRRITARAIQDRLQRLAPKKKKKCRSRKVAAEVARLFIELRQQPYGARKLKLKARPRGRRVLVQATFTRELPWDDGRTRTEVRKVTVSLDRRCRFQMVSERTLSVVYSAK
jgi:hypothetical protein